MSGYIGTAPVPQASQTRDVFTAAAGQTSFATTGYTPSFLDVYVNGVHLKNGTDYTASNGSDVVMASGLTVGDYVEVGLLPLRHLKADRRAVVTIRVNVAQSALHQAQETSSALTSKP
jgi:hypothetical protein